VISRVVTGEPVPVGRDEPFQWMADKHEFGKVSHSVFERVVQIIGEKGLHWIFAVGIYGRDERQVVRLYRPRKNQHESLQVRAGHLITISFVNRFSAFCVVTY